MNERFKIITRSNKKICISNYNNLSGNEYVDIIWETNQYCIDEYEKDKIPLLLLSDVTDSLASKEVVSTFKAVAKKIKPYAKKSAIIGITTVQRILLNAVNKFSALQTKAFETEKEAIEWLVSD